ncbi:MAG: N-acetyltransferase, partial [Prevotella sp.]
VRDTFDPNKNSGLEFSDIQAFVAYNGEGKCVGRIAGIINHRAIQKWNVRAVRFGFLEFIDDVEVSEALLNAVSDWGREHGMTQIQGPMGIYDFDKEGMLVEDFHLKGSMITIYNPPYYPEHMQRLGFRKEVDWVQFQIAVPKEVPAKYARVAALSKDLFGLVTRKLTRKEVLHEGYGKKVFDLLNVAYSPLFGYTEMSERQIDDFLKRYIPLVDMRLVTVVETTDGRLVGVAITMFGMSAALHKSRGKLFPTGWFHLLRALKWRHESKAELMLIVVDPDYQGLGVNALFFADLIPIYNKLGITWAETGPQLEDNVKELSQWKPLHPKCVKRRRCFVKEIGKL